MSKIFIMCSLLILSSITQVAFADREDRRPGRPGDDRPTRPGRPGDDRPGRPGRPGDDRPGPGRPPVQRVVYQVVDSFQVQKFIEITNTIRVNRPYVKAIKLTANKNSVEIIEARLLLDNGREIFMDGMTGNLSKDRSIIFNLGGFYGENVRSITLRSTSNLFGSRAELEVAVGTLY